MMYSLNDITNVKAKSIYELIPQKIKYWNIKI